MHMNRFVLFTAAGSALCRNKNSDGALSHTSILSAAWQLQAVGPRRPRHTIKVLTCASGVKRRELGD